MVESTFTCDPHHKKHHRHASKAASAVFLCQCFGRIVDLSKNVSALRVMITKLSSEISEHVAVAAICIFASRNHSDVFLSANGAILIMYS